MDMAVRERENFVDEENTENIQGESFRIYYSEEMLEETNRI